MIFGRLPLPGIFQSCWIIKLIHVILPNFLSLLMSVLWHLQSCIRRNFSGHEAFWSLLYIILDTGSSFFFFLRVRQIRNSLSGSVETRGDDLLCAHCFSESTDVASEQSHSRLPDCSNPMEHRVPKGGWFTCTQAHSIPNSTQPSFPWARQVLLCLLTPPAGLLVPLGFSEARLSPSRRGRDECRA